MHCVNIRGRFLGPLRNLLPHPGILDDPKYHFLGSLFLFKQDRLTPTCTHSGWLCVVKMCSLGPLPPIDAPTDTRPAVASERSAAEQAALDAELEEMHLLMGVRRGEALKEAIKPDLLIPDMPTPAFAVPLPVDEATVLKLAAAANAEKR